MYIAIVHICPGDSQGLIPSMSSRLIHRRKSLLRAHYEGQCSVMKSSCVSLVIIIIGGENEHHSVIFIFPSSKDILFYNSACKSSKEAKNIQVLHGNWVTAVHSLAGASDKWDKWRWVSSSRNCVEQRHLDWTIPPHCVPWSQYQCSVQWHSRDHRYKAWWHSHLSERAVWTSQSHQVNQQHSTHI